MKKLNSIGVSTRLYIGFFALVMVLLISSVVTLYYINTTKEYTKSVLIHQLPAYSNLLDLGSQVTQTAYALQLWLIGHDVQYKSEYIRTSKNVKSIMDSLDTLKPVGWDDVRPLLVNFLNTTTQAEQFNNPSSQNTAILTMIKQINAMKDQLLDTLDGKITTSGERVGGVYDTYYDLIKTNSNEILNDMSNVETVEFLLIIVFVLASIFISVVTSKNISKHIKYIRVFSGKIAAKDLRQRLEINTTDDIGLLGIDLNTMTDSLSSITKEIITSSQNIVSSLEEVKQAVNVQSSGATEQASSINQITASLEEIEKSSTQTMEKAKTLGLAAEKTREKGQLGLTAVEQSILGMNQVKEKVQIIAKTILDLSRQTQQVGEITAAVNALAQQSKMLALNASIEAAKAGEAGKGFAVVAAEVKNLAEQSERSTSQVQKILEDIRHATEKAVMVTEEGTKGVDQGAILVSQTGDIVRSLTDVIHETTIASQQIEAAVKQEGIGIEQIAAGMSEINIVTASFVSSAEQTNEAINHLASIAKNLKEHVDTYSL